MKKFIKENIVLAAGISLPLLLVFVFMLSGILPRFFVKPPQYDFIFMDGYEYTTSRVSFIVDGSKLNFHVDPSAYDASSIRKLYRYSAATKQLQEVILDRPESLQIKTPATASGSNNTNVVIPLDPSQLPSGEQAVDAAKMAAEINNKINEKPQPFNVPVAEFANIKLETSRIAPDGYALSDNYKRMRGFGILEYGSYGEPTYAISNSGNNIPIPYSDGYRGITFLGWVIP